MFLLNLRSVKKKVFSIEVWSNDNKRMSVGGSSITFCSHDQCFQLDAFTQDWSFLGVCKVATCGTDEADIGNNGLFVGFDQLLSVTKLLPWVGGIKQIVSAPLDSSKLTISFKRLGL
jgi:hypothetical protein